MLAVHLENLLFLLILVVAGLVQLLGRAARNTRKDETERPSSQPAPRTLKPIPRASQESDQERIRKFLEALGQPPASHPPPPVLPKTNIPPRPVAPVQPPIVYPASPWKVTRQERRKRQVILGPSPETPKAAEKKLPKAPAPVPAFEAEPLQIQPSLIKTPVEPYAAATRPGSKEDFNADIATVLASKSGLREAIILREILGSPRGLQASELL